MPKHLAGVWMAFFLAAAGRSSGAETQIIDFEDIPSDDTQAIREMSYESGGYRLSVPHGGIIFRDSNRIDPNPEPGFFGFPVNGTKSVAAWLISQHADDNPSLSRIDGGAFTLFGLDLARYSSSDILPDHVTLFGKYETGATVRRTLLFEENLSGEDAVPAFHTFELGSEWSGLVEVTFQALDVQESRFHLGMSLDNLHVTAVPEPTLMQFLGGYLALEGARQMARRARRRDLR